MKRLSRRSLLIASSAGISFAFAGRTARAAQFTFRHGMPSTVDHPLTVRAVEMWTAIDRDTGGRVEGRVFPNSVLGGDTEMLSQLRIGAVDFLSFAGVILSTVVPAAALDSVGFAFKDRQTAFKAFDGPLGAYIRSEIAKRGIHAFEHACENGFRVITSSTHPMTKVEDLAGFKMRTPPGQISVDMFRTLGANPTPMNFSEVYTALQTHVIDGQENPYAVIATNRLWEVQKYVSVTNHQWGVYWFLVNGNLWASLPADIQAVITRHAATYAQRERIDNGLLNDSLADKLRRLGMVFNTPDTGSFRAKLGPYYARQREVFGSEAWSLLEAATGHLG